MPLNTITPATSSPIRGEDAGERNEEVEEMVEDRWEEEMAGALFGSPLLALSESSCSSDSSLTSTDVGAEASVRVETDTVECPPVQSATSRQETPGVCKHGTADGMEQQSSGGEKQSSGNEERGSGGNGEGDEDEGEKNGDGEGGRKTDGDGSGNKGREEKDGDGEKDGERDEEEEDFDDLTQDEDEEEVMSSASEGIRAVCSRASGLSK